MRSRILLIPKSVRLTVSPLIRRFCGRYQSVGGSVGCGVPQVGAWTASPMHKSCALNAPSHSRHSCSHSRWTGWSHHSQTRLTAGLTSLCRILQLWSSSRARAVCRKMHHMLSSGTKEWASLVFLHDARGHRLRKSIPWAMGKGSVTTAHSGAKQVVVPTHFSGVHQCSTLPLSLIALHLKLSRNEGGHITTHDQLCDDAEPLLFHERLIVSHDVGVRQGR